MGTYVRKAHQNFPRVGTFNSIRIVSVFPWKRCCFYSLHYSWEFCLWPPVGGACGCGIYAVSRLAMRRRVPSSVNILALMNRRETPPTNRSKFGTTAYVKRNTPRLVFDDVTKDDAPTKIAMQELDRQRSPPVRCAGYEPATAWQLAEPRDLTTLNDRYNLCNA